MPVALQQSHCVCIIIHCNNSHSLKCSLWFRARRITGILNRSGLVPISDLAGPYLVPISEKSGPYLVPIRDFFQYAWSCHHCYTLNILTSSSGENRQPAKIVPKDIKNSKGLVFGNDCRQRVNDQI